MQKLIMLPLVGAGFFLLMNSFTPSPVRWRLLSSSFQIQKKSFEKDLVDVSASSTGMTTGHIANLTVKNTSQRLLTIKGGYVYIPSDGKFQRYVGQIPEGITIEPGQTISIPVSGNCVDIRSNPVTKGKPMYPDEWIPVASIQPPAFTLPPSGDPISVFSHELLPTFNPTFIPSITQAPGFVPVYSQPGNILALWPGTNSPVQGAIEPDVSPEIFAPVIVQMVERVETAADQLLSDPSVTTPFSADPAREKESVIQQTIWIYMAALTGIPYDKNGFAGNVYAQLLDNTGQDIGSLSAAEKEKVDTGIDDFWKVFTATGVKAKVLTIPSEEETKTQEGDAVLIQNRETENCNLNHTYTQTYSRSQNNGDQTLEEARLYNEELLNKSVRLKKEIDKEEKQLKRDQAALERKKRRMPAAEYEEKNKILGQRRTALNQQITQLNNLVAEYDNPNRKCMYETAQIIFEWALTSGCDCNANKECDGEIKVQLKITINNLGSYGDPGDYNLIPVKPPDLNKHTRTTDRSGAITENKIKPGPNLHLSLPDEWVIEDDAQQCRFEKTGSSYVATTFYMIPCRAGAYPVRFILMRPPENRGLVQKGQKKKYSEGLNFIADALIKIKNTNCTMEDPVVSAYATEFRTGADENPQQASFQASFQDGLRTINIDPASELPQVRVNDNITVYYSLLKLINDNGQKVDEPYMPKLRGVPGNH